MVILTSASFGTSKTGLATVGYRPKDATGAWLAVRQTAGIVEVGAGIYEASYDAPAGTVVLHWDSGEATPRYYIDDVGDATEAKQDTIIAEAQAIKAQTDLLAFTGTLVNANTVQVEGLDATDQLDAHGGGGGGGDATLQNQIDLKHITPNG